MSQQFPLVELCRDEFDSTPWHGFIVSQNESLLILHQVSDRYDLDGYLVFRQEDISSIADSFKLSDLIRRALRLKNLGPCEPGKIDLTSMRSVMESAQAAYGVLVVNREKVSPDEAEVGRVRMTSGDTYVLRWLSTDAQWDNDDRPFRYRDVTMVEFAGEYEQTLLKVALDRENGA